MQKIADLYSFFSVYFCQSNLLNVVIIYLNVHLISFNTIRLI